MERPGGTTPGGKTAEPGPDEREVARILAPLRGEDPAPPPNLAQRVGRRVRDRMTLHDLLEITTRAFARSAVLPVAERLAAFVARARPGSGPPPAGASPPPDPDL